MRTVQLMVATILAFAISGHPDARAGDDGWAALGGFIGGLIIGSAHHGSYRETVVYQRACHRPQPRAYRYERCERWVPGTWIYRSGRCGRSVKVWQPGHYTVYYKKIPRHRYGRRYAARRDCWDW